MTADYDSQISRFNFLSRGKPKAIVSQLVQQIDDKKVVPANSPSQSNLGIVEPKVVIPEQKIAQNAIKEEALTKLDDFQDKESAEVDSD